MESLEESTDESEVRRVLREPEDRFPPRYLVLGLGVGKWGRGWLILGEQLASCLQKSIF